MPGLQGLHAVRLIAEDFDLHAGADGERQAGIADGADVLLAEKVVELGEEGEVIGGYEGQVEVEFGVAEVEIVIGKEEGVAAVAVVVELEGGVVALAAEGSIDCSGETVGGVLDGEEAGVRRAAEGAVADERRESADRDAGDVRVDGGRGVVAREGLLDDGGEVGVAAAEEEMIEGRYWTSSSRPCVR